MGKTSVYLTSDLDARWRKCGVPLAALIREALDARELPPPDLPPTLEEIRGVVREELSALPVASPGSHRGYEPGYDEYEPA